MSTRLYVKCKKCERKALLGKYWGSGFELFHGKCTTDWSIEEFLTDHCSGHLCEAVDECSIDDLKLYLETDR